MSAEEVVRMYADMIYGIAYRYTARFADAEDIFSNVFLIYFKKDREFESEEHRKAWLIRVTINCAKDLLAKRKPYVELNDELDAAEDGGIPTPEAMTLEDAIASLPEQQRQVVSLFYLEDLSIREISELLQQSEGTVKSSLSRAREKMRRFMEDNPSGATEKVSDRTARNEVISRGCL
ncbi:MAG: sigma-70 family RNA polymerase sigma factor [Oscillibacter sp.]|nr:sigma-70 family RNA polymerase sigma factor [Oscillibacter sp.]